MERGSAGEGISEDGRTLGDEGGSGVGGRMRLAGHHAARQERAQVRMVLAVAVSEQFSVFGRWRHRRLASLLVVVARCRHRQVRQQRRLGVHFGLLADATGPAARPEHVTASRCRRRAHRTLHERDMSTFKCGLWWFQP